MHTYFLGLTAIGYNALWGSMVRNGAAQAIGNIKASGILPDGNPLTRTYTGIASIDRFLLSPVIFYDGLLRDRNPIYRSLLVSLFSTMQTTSFCMISSGLLKGGSSKFALLEALFWCVFNQSHGAAFVYPLYMFTHLERFRGAGNSSSLECADPADAEALVYTSLLAAIVPAWLLYPAFRPCSSQLRQVLIASYRATPALLTLAQPLLAFLIRRVRRTPVPESRTRTLVKASLIISGIFSTLGHFYALGSAVISPSVSLSKVFWPWATVIDPNGTSVDAQGCHLFLQNDWLVIIAGVVPYASAILASNLTTGADSADMTLYERIEYGFRGLCGNFVALTSLSVLLSPGALLSWALATKA